jgi:hypothetical protein
MKQEKTGKIRPLSSCEPSHFKSFTLFLFSDLQEGKELYLLCDDLIL